MASVTEDFLPDGNIDALTTSMFCGMTVSILYILQ